MLAIRACFGLIGIVWVFFVLTVVMVYMTAVRAIFNSLGWDIFNSHVQYVPRFASWITWPAFWLMGGCRLTMNYDQNSFLENGLHVVLCDHPNRQLETPVIWMAMWRIMHRMVGSFDSGHLKWQPFAIGMNMAGMALGIERKHKKQRSKLPSDEYEKLAKAADDRFRAALTRFDRVAGRLGMRLTLHLFVNSRWTEARAAEKIERFKAAYPDIEHWGKWVLMPEVGGVFTAREVLKHVSSWHMMVVTKQHERGPDDWWSFGDVIGAHYTAVLVDVTDEIKALPVTREDTAKWLGERFAPWAARQHYTARRNSS